MVAALGTSEGATFNFSSHEPLRHFANYYAEALFVQSFGTYGLDCLVE